MGNQTQNLMPETPSAPRGHELPVSNLSADAQYVLDDLHKHHSQSSWDWEADDRFSRYAGEQCLAKEAMESSAPTGLRIAASTTWDPLRQRRLKALRELVKAGLVRASWVGTGPGGKSEFGVSRIRSYFLSND